MPRWLRRLLPTDPWAYAAIGLAITATFVFFVLPAMIVDPADFQIAKDRVAAENATRTAGIQLLGGFVLVVGSYFTARSLRLNRQAQITGRFNDAITHLSGDELASRLGGIYALERIMKDDASDQGPILEILCAFIRDRAQDGRAEDEFPSPDIAAALRVIGRRKPENDPSRYTLNLSTTTLCSASFRDGDYSHTNFWRTDLRRAFLGSTDLRHAYLRSTDLRGATLRKTDLRQANLRRADLRDTEEIETARFAGATYDAATEWPTGAPPAGALLVDD
jgi:hypothetical protein